MLAHAQLQEHGLSRLPTHTICHPCHFVVQQAASTRASWGTSSNKASRRVEQVPYTMDVAKQGNDASHSNHEPAIDCDLPVPKLRASPAQSLKQASSTAVAGVGAMVLPHKQAAAAAEHPKAVAASEERVHTQQLAMPCHSKLDYLSTQPLDVLRYIFEMVMSRCRNGAPMASSGQLQWREDVSASRVKHPCRGLLCCSKQLYSIFNSFRDSLHIQMKDLAAVSKLLSKLPHLSLLSINFPSHAKGHQLLSTLNSIHGILPTLAALILHYTKAPPPSIQVQASVGIVVLLWSTTLKFLELHNIDCGSLDFLHDLIAMRALKMHGTSPPLTRAHMMGCSRLVKVNFKGLEVCESNSLDLSLCPSLTDATCCYSGITTLLVSALSQLVSLNCSNNNLTVVDVSTCTALRHYKCTHNKLVVLDVTKNIVLEVLECSNNLMYSVNLMRCVMLHTFICIGCDTFDRPLRLSQCTSLQILHVSSQKISASDLGALASLSCIIIDNNPALTFGYFKLAQADCLTRMDLSGCSIKELKLSDCNTLKKIELKNNLELYLIGVSRCIALQSLIVYNCDVHILSVGACSALKILSCNSCPVESLDLSTCTRLQDLSCKDTGLATLDASFLSKTLVRLSCSGSIQLEGVCVAGCRKLVALDCSDCSALQELRCGGCVSWKFDQSHFKLSRFRHIEEDQLRDAGAFTVKRTVSVFMPWKKVLVMGSKYWPHTISGRDEPDAVKKDYEIRQRLG